MKTINPVPGRDVWEELFQPTRISPFNRESLISRYFKEFQFFYPLAFTGDETPGLRGVVAVPAAPRQWASKEWVILLFAHDGTMKIITARHDEDVLKAALTPQPCRSHAMISKAWLGEVTKFMESADLVADGRSGAVAKKIQQVTANIRLRRSETGVLALAPDAFKNFDRVYLDAFQNKLATFMDPDLLRAIQPCGYETEQVFNTYRKIDHPDAVIVQNRKKAFYAYPGLTRLALFPATKPQLADFAAVLQDEEIFPGLSEYFSSWAEELKSMPQKPDEDSMAGFVGAMNRGEDLKPAIRALFAPECGELKPGMLARLDGQVLPDVSLATLKKCMPVLNEQNGKFLPEHGWQWRRLSDDLDRIEKTDPSQSSQQPRLK